jgi:hypothetical protein
MLSDSEASGPAVLSGLASLELPARCFATNEPQFPDWA